MNTDPTPMQVRRLARLRPHLANLCDRAADGDPRALDAVAGVLADLAAGGAP